MKNININEISKKYYCKVCNYKCNKKDSINKHFITEKHFVRSKSIQSSFDEYRCNICNYVCKKASNYNKHINTQKHITKEYNIKIISSNEVDTNKVDTNDAEQSVIMSIMIEEIKNMMIERNELKNMMIEQSKIIQEIANKPSSTNNITNNKVSNQQFNMNVFLNETCKDAMNMSEFIENLQVSMEDMEKTGELGFAKGMSRIIMNNLNAIDVCKRPIHCSDVKRETLYIKNNGVWEKETEDRKRTKEVIYKISCLNVKQLLKWRDLPRNKGYEKSDHKKNDEFTKLVMEIHKLREEEIDKVITNISKYVAIDKEKVKMSGYLD